MRPLLLSLMACCASSCQAVDLSAETWTSPSGAKVIYRLAVPEKPEAGKTYPLVLFLHGAGERGTDNSSHLKHGVKPILKGAEKIHEPCFLIAPQCPPNQWWAEPNEAKRGLKAADQPNPTIEALLALVADFSKSHPVDPNRFYVTGISMGGFGTWDMVGRAPEKIAAAIPICGGGDPKLAEKFKDVPIWAFHGEADPVVPLAATTDMIDALKKAGGSPKVTVYPGVQHESWKPAYDDPELIRWLFDQKKK